MDSGEHRKERYIHIVFLSNTVLNIRCESNIKHRALFYDCLTLTESCRPDFRKYIHISCFKFRRSGLRVPVKKRCSPSSSTVFSAFANLRKATISFLISVRPSSRMEVASHWTDFFEICYLSFPRKSVEKIRASLISDSN